LLLAVASLTLDATKDLLASIVLSVLVYAS